MDEPNDFDINSYIDNSVDVIYSKNIVTVTDLIEDKETIDLTGDKETIDLVSEISYEEGNSDSDSNSISRFLNESSDSNSI